MKRSTLNLLLVVAVAGLAAALYVGQEEETAPTPLTALSPRTVERVRIAHPQAEPVVLRRSVDGWRVVEPIDAMADGFNVESVFALAMAEVEATLQDAPSMAELGLDPPAYTVSFDDTEIAVGGTEPLQYRRYVRVDDGPVQLIRDPAEAILDADYRDLVSRKLLPDDVRLARIELPSLTVLRDADGEWRLDGQPEADPQSVAALVAGWQDAQAMWNELGEREGDDLPPADIRIVAEDGRAWQYAIVAREPQLQLLALSSGIRYHLAATMNDLLLSLSTPEEAEAAREDEVPGDPIDLRLDGS